jgi:hypothetical protein
MSNYEADRKMFIANYGESHEDFVKELDELTLTHVWVIEVEWYSPVPGDVAGVTKRQRQFPRTLRCGDYAGWTSVHRTEAGAQKHLESRAAEYGLDLTKIDSGEDTSGSTYSKSFLALED